MPDATFFKISGVKLEYLKKNYLKIEKSQVKVPKGESDREKYMRSRH